MPKREDKKERKERKEKEKRAEKEDEEEVLNDSPSEKEKKKDVPSLYPSRRAPAPPGESGDRKERHTSPPKPKEKKEKARQTLPAKKQDKENAPPKPTRQASGPIENQPTPKQQRRRTLSLSNMFSRRKSRGADEIPPVPSMPADIPPVPPLPSRQPDVPVEAPTEKKVKRRTLLGKGSLRDLFGSSQKDAAPKVRRSQSKPELRKARTTAADAPPVPSLPKGQAPPAPASAASIAPAPVIRPQMLVPDALAALTARSEKAPVEFVPDLFAAFGSSTVSLGTVERARAGAPPPAPALPPGPPPASAASVPKQQFPDHPPRSDSRSSNRSNFEAHVGPRVRSDSRSSNQSKYDARVEPRVRSDSRSSNQSKYDARVEPRARSDSRSSNQSKYDARVEPRARSDSRSSNQSRFDARVEFRARSDSRSSGNGRFDARVEHRSESRSDSRAGHMTPSKTRKEQKKEDKQREKEEKLKDKAAKRKEKEVRKEVLAEEKKVQAEEKKERRKSLGRRLSLASISAAFKKKKHDDEAPEVPAVPAAYGTAPRQRTKSAPSPPPKSEVPPVPDIKNFIARSESRGEQPLLPSEIAAQNQPRVRKSSNSKSAAQVKRDYELSRSQSAETSLPLNVVAIKPPSPTKPLNIQKRVPVPSVNGDTRKPREESMTVVQQSSHNEPSPVESPTLRHLAELGEKTTKLPAKKPEPLVLHKSDASEEKPARRLNEEALAKLTSNSPVPQILRMSEETLVKKPSIPQLREQVIAKKPSIPQMLEGTIVKKPSIPQMREKTLVKKTSAPQLREPLVHAASPKLRHDAQLSKKPSVPQLRLNEQNLSHGSEDGHRYPDVESEDGHRSQSIQSHATGSTAMPSFNQTPTGSPTTTIRSVTSTPRETATAALGIATTIKMPDGPIEPDLPSPSPSVMSAAEVHTAQTARRSKFRSMTANDRLALTDLGDGFGAMEELKQTHTGSSADSTRPAMLFGSLGRSHQAGPSNSRPPIPSSDGDSVTERASDDDLPDGWTQVDGMSESDRDEFETPMLELSGFDTPYNPLPATSRAASDESHDVPRVSPNLSMPASAPASLSRGTSPIPKVTAHRASTVMQAISITSIGDFQPPPSPPPSALNEALEDVSSIISSAATRMRGFASAVSTALSPASANGELPSVSDEEPDTPRSPLRNLETGSPIVYASPSGDSTATFNTARTFQSPESANSATFETFESYGPSPTYTPAVPPPQMSTDVGETQARRPDRRGSMPAALAAAAARRRTVSTPTGRGDEEGEDLPCIPSRLDSASPSPPGTPPIRRPYTGRSATMPNSPTVDVQIPTLASLVSAEERRMAFDVSPPAMSPSDSQPESPLDLNMPALFSPIDSSAFVVPFPSDDPLGPGAVCPRSPTVNNYATTAAARERSRRDSGIASTVGGLGFARQGPIDSVGGVAVSPSRSTATAPIRREPSVRHSLPTVVDYSLRSARNSRASFGAELSLWADVGPGTGVEGTIPESGEGESVEESFQLDSSSCHSSSASDELDGAPCTPRTPDLDTLTNMSPPSAARDPPSTSTSRDNTPSKTRLVRGPFRAMHYDMSQETDADESYTTAADVSA